MKYLRKTEKNHPLYKELKQFHADHYNPANSQILTYGAVDLEATAVRLNDSLLSVPAGQPAAKIEPEPRWGETRKVEFSCPWNTSASDPTKQATAALSWFRVFCISDVIIELMT